MYPNVIASWREAVHSKQRIIRGKFFGWSFHVRGFNTRLLSHARRLDNALVAIMGRFRVSSFANSLALVHLFTKATTHEKA
jgi:hypothetical protein